MRVVLATSEEPLYLPEYLRPVFEAHADAIEGVALVPFEGGAVEQLREQVRAWGPRGTVRLGGRFVGGRLAGALPGPVQRRLPGGYRSVERLARSYDLPVRQVPDAGAPAFADWIRERDPDLLLSVVAGQLLPEPVLDAANLAVNCHGSLLPKYRGRATAFWPLYHGDDETGVTAHLMTEAWDAGPILRQRSVPIAADDSMHDVNRKLAETGAFLVVDLLADLRAGQSPDPRPNPTEAYEYRSLPTPAERREFRRRGNRFV
ncbi:methionyl-tRNA formyltransferase [Haloglomus halophilum]|uniref:methionyl-tRNA formyltransferase n=1 Tax=Haloglomus halophilum TaxID=2962672 RepID=UPI0020C9EA7A|nr:formyltransferase family protein [Haloglomus halophilum]